MFKWGYYGKLNPRMVKSYEEQISELRAIYPHIELAGVAVWEDGKPADMVFLYAPALFFARGLELHGRQLNPKVILSASPLPNAYADIIESGELRLNLGLPFAFLSMPRTVEYLLNILSKKRQLNIDELIEMSIPHECVEELNNVRQSWEISAGSDWKTPVLPPSAATNEKIFMFLYAIAFYHEIGHLQELYEDKLAWEGMLLRTKRYFEKMYEENQNSVWSLLGKDGDLLENKEVFFNWINEIQADLLAYTNIAIAPKDFKWQQDDHALISLSFSLFYFILYCFEIFVQARWGIDFVTHPPTEIRKQAFEYALAGEYKLSIAEFKTRKWGASLMCEYLLKKYISQFG